ncbi:MAG: hypothetical protein ABMB14_10045, partial [Myxococcota bacterium]
MGVADLSTAVDSEVHGDLGLPLDWAWSADGRWLAVASLGSGDAFPGTLSVAEVDGPVRGEPIVAERVALPSGLDASDPVWLSDGTLVFEGRRDERTRLYRLRPGGEAEPLLDEDTVPGELVWPSASPDGRWLAFVARAAGELSGDVWLRDTDRGAVRLL